jgi:hypothetical protein
MAIGEKRVRRHVAIAGRVEIVLFDLMHQLKHAIDKIVQPLLEGSEACGRSLL